MAPKTPAGQTRNQVFRFVRDRLMQGVPPTVREVQEAFRFKSVQTAREHLEKLVSEGRLGKRDGVSRGYHLPDEADIPTRFAVPVLGRVQAGALTEAIAHPDGYIGVDGRSGAEELFALKVVGFSMVNAGILPGDMVVVRRQASATSGDIVVAMVDGEATVKRLRMVRGRPQLHPENDDFAPIVPQAGEELLLLGKVVEVRRRLD